MWYRYMEITIDLLGSQFKIDALLWLWQKWCSYVHVETLDIQLSGLHIDVQHIRGLLPVDTTIFSEGEIYV